MALGTGYSSPSSPFTYVTNAALARVVEGDYIAAEQPCKRLCAGESGARKTHSLVIDADGDSFVIIFDI